MSGILNTALNVGLIEDTSIIQIKYLKENQK